MVGPPGTAKSEIARRLSHVIKNGEYFEYLLTKFTTPEEIFGPLSIKELKDDRFSRNTQGYMPDAKVAFLDEIFKANSSILNSLLTIINEKIYHNGKEKLKVPLISLVGASNELPAGDDELNALYDRFIVKLIVDYVKNDEDVRALFNVRNKEFTIDENNAITEEELLAIKKNFCDVKIPENVTEAIEEIRSNYKRVLEENNKVERLSDRKFIKLLNLLKVAAYTNGRDELNFSDLLLLRNCLWNDPKNAHKISEIIVRIVNKNCVEAKKAITSVVKKNTKAAIKNGSFKGVGTEHDPYLIENEHDLYSIGNQNFSTAGVYFRQTADIDLSSFQNWDPLPSFGGHYDGGGYKIANLKITNKIFAGLFEKIEKDSTVKNIVLDNVDISSAGNSGGISGINEGTISECCVSGKVSAAAENLNTYSGGITGKNSGNIDHCSINGVISSKMQNYNSYSSYSGGITGKNNGNIDYCSVIGEISSASNAPDSSSPRNLVCSGGITGSNEGIIHKSFVNAKVSSSSEQCGSYSGGISGCNINEISECSVSGDISSTTPRRNSGNSGGITGQNEGTILNCLVSKESSVKSSGFLPCSGGISHYNYGKILSCIVLSKIISGEHEPFRICENYIRGTCGTLENNYAIDSLEIAKGFSANEIDRESNLKGANGKSVNKNILTKAFFERDLKWDFEQNWYWDDGNNIPVPAGVGYNFGSNESKKNTVKISQNLLEEQLKDNIWL
ncbi:MAG TPA: AAA family ATPase [Candidatus Wallbacteria bacterium]|nr:AAA family ATPase [Candidatus Wallbacteria bacterium]